ncbi:MAG: hypothetical protein QOE36_1614, partial [Gaiellaceae bacterium]|nr:hypothetical protein [Gaiellaceae bacterium]
NTLLVVAHFGIPVAAARIAARAGSDRRYPAHLRAAALAGAGPCLVASAAMAGTTAWVTSSLSASLIAAAGMATMAAGVVLGGLLRGVGRIWSSALIQPVNALAQLVVLGAAAGLGAQVGVGWVLLAFYAGNAAALAVAGALYLAVPRETAESRDVDAHPASILRFSAWLTLATIGVYGLTLAPRLVLAQASYRDVAIFDLALLAYTLPQRLTASFVTALVPVAAREQLQSARVPVASRVDAFVVTALVGGASGILWVTGLLGSLLHAVGLGAYTASAPLLIIVLLAAPAELFFAVNSGLLQAFGLSKRLAAGAWGVLAVAGLAMPFAARIDSAALAAVVVAGYWALLLVSRALLGNLIEEKPLWPVVLRLPRPKQAVA